MREVNGDMYHFLKAKAVLNRALSTVCPGSGIWPVSLSGLWFSCAGLLKVMPG